MVLARNMARTEEILVKKNKKTLEFKFERVIPASPSEVYNSWLSPKTPGTPWHEAKKLILNPTVDGFFYWLFGQTPHYGRFTKISKGSRIQHTWMSPYTLGQESLVTVTFKKKGQGTLMTLLHTGLPNDEGGKSHEYGWNYFLDKFTKRLE